MNILPRRNSGFTLIEILVVILIVGLLASVVGPNLIGKLGGAKTKTAKLQVEELSAALDLYYLELDSYPATAQGLRALIQAPEGGEAWNGPYLKKQRIPLDPWGREYQYRSPGQHGAFDLWSWGADGAEGGDAEAADVVSWL